MLFRYWGCWRQLFDSLYRFTVSQTTLYTSFVLIIIVVCGFDYTLNLSIRSYEKWWIRVPKIIIIEMVIEIIFFILNILLAELAERSGSIRYFNIVKFCHTFRSAPSHSWRYSCIRLRSIWSLFIHVRIRLCSTLWGSASSPICSYEPPRILRYLR